MLLLPLFARKVLVADEATARAHTFSYRSISHVFWKERFKTPCSLAEGHVCIYSDDVECFVVFSTLERQIGLL